MARRMFSPQIIDSDAFLEMSTSAQNLYFHLGMRADDDGFVSNPKKIVRAVGGNEDDIKLLLVKRFILDFDNGIIVIKHWRINNLVRKDWYKPTQYIEEKATLFVKENGAYTRDSEQGVPLVNGSLTKLVQVRQRRLGKVRLGKVIKHIEGFEDFWERYPKKVAKNAAIKAFEKINPTSELLSKILSSIEKNKKTEFWIKSGGQFIPYPATWLNGKRWEDEIESGPITTGAIIIENK